MMLLSIVHILIAIAISNGQQMEFWLTDPDANIRFEQQPFIQPKTNYYFDNDMIIVLNDTTTYQTIDGFGFALTDGSALHLQNLNDTIRAQILHELFSTDNKSIGISYLRISIGASDLSPAAYSYDDLSTGETDINMTHFDLGFTRLHVIPILKEILAINPNIKLLGSPWSPPTWMKTNQHTVGGSLMPEYYDAYAHYFVRYIQEMQKQGITMHAITVQNEPLFPYNNPSLSMTAADQAQFIKQNLGPAFLNNSITTKIVIYDFNCDHPEYPIAVLQDSAARQYIDGSAFHLYSGNISVLSTVHDQFPDKNIYFTERGIYAPGNFKKDLNWHVKNLIIGATRNWARNVLEWNLASNSIFEPHTHGGCPICLGGITIDGNRIVSRNPGYYVIAHAAKFVRPNSIRIDSNMLTGLSNVAFQRSNDHRKVLIVLNENSSSSMQSFQIQCNGKIYDTSLNAGSVGTYIC